MNYEWYSPDDAHRQQSFIPARSGYPTIQPGPVEPPCQPQNYPARDIIPPQITDNYETIRNKSNLVPHTSNPVKSIIPPQITNNSVSTPGFLSSVPPISNPVVREVGAQSISKPYFEPLIREQPTQKPIIVKNQTEGPPSTRPKIQSGNLRDRFPPGLSRINPTAGGPPNSIHPHHTILRAEPQAAGYPAIS